MGEVVLDEVSKTYAGDVPAVRQVSLRVRDGEFLVLVGPSGCGKSTLLRMIAGLETVTSGTISIAGRDVQDVPPRERDVAMVFQNYALYPHMSVAENLSFGLKLRKVAREDIAQRVREAAAMLGIEELLYRRPRELSGGQRQRVALGRAIVRQPAVFLFDEPLSNLDALLRMEMRRELSRVHRELGITTIYVTHDQTEAMTLGDRIVIMNRGEVQQVGPPLEVYRQPKNLFVAGFLGSPPMNQLRGKLISAGQDFSADSPLRFIIENSNSLNPFSPGKTDLRISASREAEGGEAASFSLPGLSGSPSGQTVLGIRPEDLELQTDAPSQTDALPAVVEDVQPLGNETLVYLKTAGQSLIARTNAETTVAPGDRITLNCRPDRFHLFDPQGERIRKADSSSGGTSDD